MAADPVWLSGAFIGEFGDPYIEDTELEGNSPHAAIAVVVKMLDTLVRETDDNGWRLDTAQLLAAAESFRTGLTVGAGSSVPEMVRSLRSHLLSMAPDDYVMIPTGWTAFGDDSHAIMVHFHRRATAFDIAVVNTGAGIQFHPNMGFADGGKCKCAMRFHDVPIESVTSPAGLWMLCEITASSSTLHCDTIWYRVYLEHTLGKPLNVALSERLTLEDSPEDGDWVTPQRAGTCYYRCVLASLRYFLRMRGYSKEQRKRATVYLRLIYMQHARSAMLSPGVALSASDVRLLRIGIKQTAYHTLKAVKKEHLTFPEAASIERELRAIDHEVIPSCLFKSWVDRGPAPVSLAGGVLLLPRPVFAGSGPALLANRVIDASVIGSLVTVDTDAPLDVLGRLHADPPEGIADLSKAFDVAQALAESLAAGSAGVSPAAGKQSAFVLLSRLLLSRLPRGRHLKSFMLSSSSAVGTSAFAGGRFDPKDCLAVASKAAAMTTTIVALWQASPRLDVHGIAQRNLSVLACACIVDALLRYGPTSDSLVSTQLLRGRLLPEALSRITGEVGAGGSRLLESPTMLHFESASGIPLPLLTARLELLDPLLREGRRAVCEYVELARRDCALTIMGRDSDPSTKSLVCTAGGVHPPHPSVADVERSIPHALAFSWLAEGSDDASFVLTKTDLALKQGEAVFRVVGEPLVSAECLSFAKETTGDSTLRPDLVETLIFRAWNVSNKGSLRRCAPDACMLRDLNLLLQAVLEPIDERSIIPPSASFSTSAHCADLDLVGLNSEITKAKLAATVCGGSQMTRKDYALGRGLPYSHCDPRSHGVKARLPHSLDEDDIMLATRVDSFDDVLTPEDAERLLSGLTTSTLRVPLTIGFFTDSRVGALFNADLRQLLWSCVFQAGDLGCVPDSDGLGEPAHDVAPAPTSSLSTPHGPLWYELRHSPASSIQPLVALVRAASHLCGSGSGNVFLNTLLFVARLVARVDQCIGSILQDDRLSAAHAALAAQRKALHQAIEEFLLPALTSHDQRALHQQVMDRHVAIMAHRALLCIGDTEADMTAERFATVLGGVSLVRVFHSFGTQHEQPSEPSKWRSLVPKPPQELFPGSQECKTLEGVEPGWMGSDVGIRLTEHDIAELVDTLRPVLVGWIRAQTPEQRSEALDASLRIALQSKDADWDHGESAPSGSRPKDNVEQGLFSGGGGRFLFVLQHCELRSLAGHSINPVPEEVAKSPFFTTFFGPASVPYCSISERTQARICLSIVNSPDLAGHGELSVHYWRAPTDPELQKRHSSAARAISAIKGGGYDSSDIKSAASYRTLECCGYPVQSSRDGCRWMGRSWTKVVVKEADLVPGAVSVWVAELLQECLLDELDEARTPIRCKKKFMEPFEEDIKTRVASAGHLLTNMLLVAADDASGAADGDQVCTLLWFDRPSGFCREVVVHKEGWVEVFTLEEFGRRVWRIPVYSSDGRKSMAGPISGSLAMSPLPFAINSEPPLCRKFRVGDVTESCLAMRSVEVIRKRREGSELVESTLIPAFFLRGLLPSHLLDLPLLWWLRADGSLVGEPAPATAKAQVGVTGPSSKRAAGEEAAEDAPSATEEDDARKKTVVIVRPCALGLWISRHMLYPGIRAPGAVGAAAASMFGEDHVRIAGDVVAPPGAIALFWDSVVTTGCLTSVRDAVVRAESASHLAPVAFIDPDSPLAEKLVQGEAPEGSALLALAAVELPRLDTSFQVTPSSFAEHGFRLYLSDRDGLFLNDDPGAVLGWDSSAPARPMLPGALETAVGLTPTGLLAGLPHSLLLRGDDGSSHLFVPSHPLGRPFVTDGPFSEHVTQNRGAIAWRALMSTKTFVFSASVSEGFYRVPSLAAALYTFQCLMAHRLYSRAARLLRSVDTDKPLTLEESYLLRSLQRFSGDKTPDASACRCLLSLSLRYVDSITFPWGLGAEHGRVLSLRGHVQALCQLSHEQVASIADMLKNEDLAQQHRGYIYGATTVLQPKHECGIPGPPPTGTHGYEERAVNYLTGYAKPVPSAHDLQTNSGCDHLWDFCCSSSDVPKAPLANSEAQQFLHQLVEQSWSSNALDLIRLAVGDIKVDLLGDGTNSGRELAPLLSKCALNKLFNFKAWMLSQRQAFPYVIAASASYLNADGTYRSPRGEHSGFPSPPNVSGSTRVPEMAAFVHDIAKKLVDLLESKGMKKHIPPSEAPKCQLTKDLPLLITPDMAPPQPPPTPATTPEGPLIIRAFHDGSSTTVSEAIAQAASKTLAGEQDPATVALAASRLSRLDVAAFGGSPLLSTLCQISEACAHPVIAFVGPEQRGEELPSGDLPFQVRTADGDPLPRSFVGESMLKRLARSCADFRSTVAASRDPQLAALVQSSGNVVTPDALATESVRSRAIFDVEAIIKHLEQLKKAEMRIIRAGVPAVLTVANGLTTRQAASLSSLADAAPALSASLSALDREEDAPLFIRTSLERLAMSRVPISDEQLVSVLLSPNAAVDLCATNPMLPRERARAASEAAGALLLRANRVSFCSFCLRLAFSVLSSLKKYRTPSAESHGIVLRAGASLAGALLAKRHCAVTEPPPRGGEVDFWRAPEADEAQFDPRFIVFEFLNGWLLRRRQVEVVSRFVREMGIDVYALPPAIDEASDPMSGTSAEEEEQQPEEDVPDSFDGLDLGDIMGGDVGGPSSAAAKRTPGQGVRGAVVSRVRQMKMGMGKTACISPLCCLFMANGRSIVTQVVPTALLAQTQDLLSQTFAQIIPKRVVTLDFDRAEADNPVALNRLKAKVLATARDRGVLITTASALKSMALLFVEEAGKALGTDGVRDRPREDREKQVHFEAAQTIASILQQFSSEGGGRLLLDEVDMLFSPLRSELNYPISETILIGPRPARWTLPVDLIAVVQAATLEARGESSSSLADAGPVASLVTALQQGSKIRALQLQPHLVLLDRSFYVHSLVPAVARWVAWWLLGSGELGQAKGSIRPKPEALQAALMAPSTADAAFKSACSGLSQPAERRLLAHARQWVLTLLPHALSKVNRVSYGLLTGRHASSSAARTRLLTSVPFLGLDVPSPVSEHAHPDVLIGLTTLAYAYEGLQVHHLKEIAKDLRHAMNKQSGAISERPARRTWQAWCSEAREAWKARYQEVADRISSQRSAGQVPTIVSSGAPDEASFNEASEGLPDVPPLELVQLEDDSQVSEIFRLLRKHGPVARFFLVTTVFPFVCKHLEAKLSASGQELGTDLLFEGRCGFSGTPNDLIPLELGACDFEPGSEGEFLSTLTTERVVSIDSVVARGMEYVDASGQTTWSVRRMLTALANADPPYHALIDCGALVTGLSNAETARFLLRVGLQSMRGVVYMDDQNEKMVIMRGRPEPVPLGECGLGNHQRFTLYDQSHTTGTDIKQAPSARALLTVGKDNTLRDIFQAAWRMRGIGIGQTISYLITPEVLTQIHRCRGPTASASEPLLQGLFGWLLHNSVREEGLMFAQLCKQDMAHTWRKPAFQDLQVSFGGAHVSKGSPDVAPASSFADAKSSAFGRSVRSCLQVFRESVSFEIPDPLEAATAGGSGLHAMLKHAQAAFGTFVLGPQPKQRTERILERASTTVAPESDQDLSSEMVQEQEQEIEAEQEEDAEREAELAQWYGAPDVAVPAPARWELSLLLTARSVADLRRGITKSFELADWKPSVRAPSLKRGIPSSVLASSNWCPQDITREPEYRIKLAAAVLSIGSEGGVLLSLAEAEAVRRAFHTGAAKGSTTALWLIRSSDAVLLDDPSGASVSVGERPTLPPDSPLACAGLFVNNEVWIDAATTTGMLRTLSGIDPTDRLTLFEVLLTRRRDRKRAWQVSGMRDVFSLRDERAAQARDRQVNELLRRLRDSGVHVTELFARADADMSGRLDDREIRAIAAQYGLSISAEEASAVCQGLAMRASGALSSGQISLSELGASVAASAPGAAREHRSEAAHRDGGSLDPALDEPETAHRDGRSLDPALDAPASVHLHTGSHELATSVAPPLAAADPPVQKCNCTVS
jgi:hypothetical protein